ncbi:MAG: aldo/keto reductase [Firmicutes bacterium]|nr:aldo/keto reductase [Bacillota bacterium]
MLTTKNGDKVFPIAIGTWTINNSTRAENIEAILYNISKGGNLIEANATNHYSGGESFDVCVQALKQVDRDKIFITAVLMEANNEDDIDKNLEIYLSKLGTDYVDCISWGTTLDNLGLPIERYLAKMNQLKKQGKTRFVGISNISPEDYKKYGPFDYFEGLYNFECRINEDNGLLSMSENFFAYQPLRRNRTAKMNYPILVELSKKYDKTQNQIILNWLLKHKKIKVLLKAANKQHIDENFDSLGFDMSPKDYTAMDNFRSEFFDNLQVVFHTPTESEKAQGKIVIHQIPNQEPS